MEAERQKSRERDSGREKAGRDRRETVRVRERNSSGERQRHTPQRWTVWGKRAESPSPRTEADTGYGEAQARTDAGRKIRPRNRDSGRVRGGYREPEAENDVKRGPQDGEDTD